jgi:DNA-binding protein H-NS
MFCRRHLGVALRRIQDVGVFDRTLVNTQLTASAPNEGNAKMAAVKIDNLSLKELLDLEIRVKKQIGLVRDREKSEAKQELVALAERRGFSLSELLGGRGAKGSKVAVKYRNKDNPAETWTGRGRQPRWLVALLKRGKKLEDFAV